MDKVEVIYISNFAGRNVMQCDGKRKDHRLRSSMKITT